MSTLVRKQQQEGDFSKLNQTLNQIEESIRRYEERRQKERNISSIELINKRFHIIAPSADDQKHHHPPNAFSVAVARALLGE